MHAQLSEQASCDGYELFRRAIVDRSSATRRFGGSTESGCSHDGGKVKHEALTVTIQSSRYPPSASTPTLSGLLRIHYEE